MNFVSLPLYLSKIGNKGKILRKKTKIYKAIPPDDVKPRGWDYFPCNVSMYDP